MAYASEVKLFGRWQYEGISLGDIGASARLAPAPRAPPPPPRRRRLPSPRAAPCPCPAALEDYVAVKAKDSVYLPHTGAWRGAGGEAAAPPPAPPRHRRRPRARPRPPAAGRYQVKRFRKALCPIVERLCNALMRKGRNNGKKLLAGACARRAARAAPRRARPRSRATRALAPASRPQCALCSRRLRSCTC